MTSRDFTAAQLFYTDRCRISQRQPRDVMSSEFYDVTHLAALTFNLWFSVYLP